jgi:hypothetical protein
MQAGAAQLLMNNPNSPDNAVPRPARAGQTAQSLTQSTLAGQQAARECAAIAADLERLKALFVEAGDKLLASFNRVAEVAPQLSCGVNERRALDSAVGSAVTALQFQDMAAQLTGHAQRRLKVLQNCVHTMSADGTDPLLADTRLQPVKQNGMGAGSIDLF